MGTKRLGLARIEALIEALDRNLNLSSTTLTNVGATTFASTVGVTGVTTLTGQLAANFSGANWIGTKKWSSFAGTLAATDTGTAYGNNEVLVYLGALDTTLPSGHAAATKILVEKIVCCIQTAAGQTLVGHIDAGTAASQATNVACTGRVELFGAGATQLSPEGYELATTATEADDLDLNSAGVYWCAPNIVLPVATNQMYCNTTTALNADAQAGRFNVHIEYVVL